MDVSEVLDVSGDERELFLQEQARIRFSKLLNRVIIGVANDPYQKMFVDSTIEDIQAEKQSYIISSDSDLKRLKHLTRKAILDSNNIVRISINCRVTENMITFLKSIYFKNKLLFIFVHNNRTVHYVSDRLQKEFNDLKITKLELAEDYGAKKEIIEKALENWRINFKDKATRNLMVKIMISQEEDLESIRNSLDVAKISRMVITKEFLESSYDNLEFLKLDDFFELIVRSSSPKKIREYTDYFLNSKAYAPDWILNMFKEYVLKLNSAYSLKARGILKHPLDSVTLGNRLKYANIPDTKNFAKLRGFEQQNILDIVNDIPYNYISHLSKIVFREHYLSVDALGLRELLLEVNLLKNQYDKPKGFRNERAFQEFLKSRR